MQRHAFNILHYRAPFAFSRRRRIKCMTCSTSPSGRAIGEIVWRTTFFTIKSRMSRWNGRSISSTTAAAANAVWLFQFFHSQRSWNCSIVFGIDDDVGFVSFFVFGDGHTIILCVDRIWRVCVCFEIAVVCFLIYTSSCLELMSVLWER